jgi:hypothetical protein
LLRLIGLTAIAGILAVAAPAQPQTTPAPSVTVAGTAFHVTLPNGAELAQEQLPGTVLTFGDGSGARRRIRIESVEHDARDPTGEVILYGLSEIDQVSGEWRNACNPDPDGRRLGFPLSGAFTADGTYQPALIMAVTALDTPVTARPSICSTASVSRPTNPARA